MAENAAPSSQTTTLQQLQQLVDEVVKAGGLVAHLKDGKVEGDVIDFVTRETNIPAILVRLAYRWTLIPVVELTESKARDGAQTIVAKVATHIERHLGTNAATRLLAPLRQAMIESALAKKREAASRERLRAVGVDQAAGLSLNALSAEISSLDQRETSEFRDELREQLLRLRSAVERQPPLDLTLVPARGDKKGDWSGFGRFVYSTRSFEFQGRTAEMAALRDFARTPEPFGWWTIAAPHGAGKSCLALEFALELGPSWQAGFVRPRNDATDAWADWPWHEWRPLFPTLIIIDDAALRAGHAGAVVEALTQRGQTGELTWPVRMLLLDRHTGWISELERDEVRRELIHQTRHDEPLGLEPLGRGACEGIVRQFAPKASDDIVERALMIAEKIDPQGRPLYLAFVADAVAAGKDPSGWNRIRLLSEVLGKAEKRWEALGANAEDRAILTLATLRPPLRFRDLERLAGTPLPRRSDRSQADRLAAMLDLPSLDDSVPALAPDILGIFFVLQRLQDWRRFNDTDADAVVAAAWRTARMETAIFLRSAREEFPDHRETILALRALPPRGQRAFWSILVTDAVKAAFASGNVEAVKELHRALKAIYRDDPDHQVMTMLAFMTRELIAHEAAQGDLSAAHRAMNELLKLPVPSCVAERQRRPQGKVAPAASESAPPELDAFTNPKAREVAVPVEGNDPDYGHPAVSSALAAHSRLLAHEDQYEAQMAERDEWTEHIAGAADVLASAIRAAAHRVADAGNTDAKVQARREVEGLDARLNQFATRIPDKTRGRKTLERALSEHLSDFTMADSITILKEVNQSALDVVATSFLARLVISAKCVYDSGADLPVHELQSIARSCAASLRTLKAPLANHASATEILTYSQLLVYALDKAGHAAVARPIVAALFGINESALTPSAVDERDVDITIALLGDPPRAVDFLDVFLRVAAVSSSPAGRQCRLRRWRTRRFAVLKRPYRQRPSRPRKPIRPPATHQE